MHSKNQYLQTNYASYIFLFILSVFLVSCSGDSGNDNDAIDTNSNGNTLLIGQFIDSPVSGINYQTVSGSGTTNIKGEFHYEDGETVTFSLGDTILGLAQGAGQITLFDLAGIIPPTGTALRESVMDDTSALQHVMNTAVLLQTLDNDGDPSNGIEITPVVADLFEGSVIDLDMPNLSFRKDPLFRNIVFQVNDQNLLSRQIRLRKSAYALQHLYNSTGTVPELLDIIRRSEDANADTTFDNYSIFEYNSYGSLTGNQYDSDANGSPELIDTITYDINGYKTINSRDTDANGAPNKIDTFFYDAYGYLTSVNTDSEADGLADKITTYTRDVNGYPTSMTLDSDADGSPDKITTYSYDANGNKTGESTDTNADGSIDSITTYSYDASGYKTLTVVDTDANGTPDRIISYTHDSNGNQTSVQTDIDANGTPDRIDTFTYDAFGNETRWSQDVDGNGVPDRINDYTYDLIGNKTSEQFDTDANGAPDQINTFIYDANGKLVREENDTNADSSPETIISYEYTSVGIASFISY